jgi:raffinose/stachyose/melibiose transport system permease protein
MRTARSNILLLYMFALILLIVFLVPLFYVFNTSFKTETEFLQNSVGLASTFHFKNYMDAWGKANFDAYLLNSVFYVVMVVGFSLLMALFLAFPLARKAFGFTSLIYSLFLAGMFLPNGIIPLFRLLLSWDLYNTRTGYILTMVTGGGVTLFFFVSFIKSIPKDFDEAAAIEGCGYFRYILSIMVPLMKPAISSMAILATINVWNEIINSILFLSDDRLFPVTRGLFVFKGQYSVSWTLFTAALTIVAVPLIILYIFLQRFIIDGVVAGGVKG